MTNTPIIPGPEGFTLARIINIPNICAPHSNLSNANVWARHESDGRVGVIKIQRDGDYNGLIRFVPPSIIAL